MCLHTCPLNYVNYIRWESLDVSIVCCSNFPFSIYITLFAVVL